MNYYERQLSRIDTSDPFAPTVKISGTDNSTNWMDLNAESAKALTEWLQANFLPRKIECTRVKNDVNGNPRYVFHFGVFIDPKKDDHVNSWSEEAFKLALSRARKLGGKAYRGKDFGGGIVFQSYNVQDLIERIRNREW